MVNGMRYLRGTWMRGGTSKCWLFEDAAVAFAGGDAEVLLADAFGAGDPRQLDGVGGATSTTSKAAIVRRSAVAGVDIDYEFAQVGVDTRHVEWGSNCGNCATAIGLYALLAGLVQPRSGHTTVRMRHTNTGAMLAVTVATPGGTVPESGTATVPGIAVGGVGVELAFRTPEGATTGARLPTGHPVDALPPAATLIDAGAPTALFDAAVFGLSGGESVEQLAPVVPDLVRLRREAALRMGLATSGSRVDHALPKTGVVAAPVDYRTTDGVPISAGDYDLAVRMLSMLAPHPAVGLTSAVALAAAADIAGGVVSGCMRDSSPDVLRLGTPAGVVTVAIDRAPDGTLCAVRIPRAARRIAVADIAVPEPALVPTTS